MNQNFLSHLPLRGQCWHCLTLNQNAPASRLTFKIEMMKAPEVRGRKLQKWWVDVKLWVGYYERVNV